jgi:hypothetical protein
VEKIIKNMKEDLVKIDSSDVRLMWLNDKNNESEEEESTYY